MFKEAIDFGFQYAWMVVIAIVIMSALLFLPFIPPVVTQECCNTYCQSHNQTCGDWYMTDNITCLDIQNLSVTYNPKYAIKECGSRTIADYIFGVV